MSSRRVIFVEKMFDTPTWDEVYAASSTDSLFPADTTDTEESKMATCEPDDPEEEEGDPVSSKEEDWSLPVLFSPLDPLPSPAPSWSPLHAVSRTSAITLPPEVGPGRADASRPHRARGCHPYRAHMRSCFCCCSHRRHRPGSYTSGSYSRRRYRPRSTTPRQHFPVAIQPTRWYEVVGRMVCSNCSAKGRHQMTPWMCQSCEEPLCLMTYRNCYAEWHGQRR